MDMCIYTYTIIYEVYIIYNIDHICNIYIIYNYIEYIAI